MSRAPRQIKHPFVFFCEGDTEYNYLSALLKNVSNVSARFINMSGGGYKSYLDAIKRDGTLNRLASFIIIDGDRAHKVPEEKNALEKLIDYCRRQNKKSAPPYLLIVNCPDFEYVACLHDVEYKGGDTGQHIVKKFGFKNLSEFKSKADIYEFLQTGTRSYSTMLKRLERRRKFIQNEINADRMVIRCKNSAIDWDEFENKTSNIDEVFGLVMPSVS